MYKYYAVLLYKCRPVNACFTSVVHDQLKVIMNSCPMRSTIVLITEINVAMFHDFFQIAAMNACYFKPLAILDCSFSQLGRFCFYINTEVITLI